ncbi:hypothetical protein QYB63_001213 [Clostridium perfringens]|nr:hypothetical protein [Clostridium perfringens]
MEYIQLISIIFCLYILITNLKEIELYEGFYSVLENGSNLGQDLREFMQETKSRMKKENRGYMIILHSINIISIIITVFIFVFGDIRSFFIPILIGLFLLGATAIEMLILESESKNIDIKI